MFKKQNNPAFFERIHPLAWQLLFVGFSILVFTLILLNRSPFLLRPVSIALRSGFGVMLLLATLVMFAVFLIPGRLGELSALTATMSLFALGLAGLWASGKTQSILLNGLLPLYDAAGYYVDALRIQHGMSVSTFTAMRPFFAGLLSFFLWLSGQNLMVAVSVFTALAGYACYLTCREIQRSHGTLIAVFFLMLIFLYYRHHSGTTMSESFAVTISLLGTALILLGISARKEWVTLGGITIFAVALNIRPGAMFVLPALLLWGAWVFRGQTKFSFRFFLIGTACVVLTFLANRIMINILAGPDATAFENFAWAVYGLASGGNSWTYVFEAHPELSLLEPAQVTPTIYKLAFELILTNPSLIFKGAFFYWKMFFSNTWYNAYAFVAGDNYWVNETARWGMYILGSLGIFKWFRERTDPYAGLALVGALGVLASVPFVPPTDGYRVRLYAATIPFFIMLPAMGLSFLEEKFISRFPHFQIKIQIASGSSSPVFSIILIAVMLFSPILVKKTGSIPAAPEAVCPTEMEGYFTRFNTGSSFNLHQETKVFLDWMPDFHMSLFRSNVHNLPDSHLIGALENISPSTTLFYALDPISNQEAIVIAWTDQLPQQGTWALFCGSWEKDPDLADYNLFFAEQVIPVK